MTDTDLKTVQALVTQYGIPWEQCGQRWITFEAEDFNDFLRALIAQMQRDAGRRFCARCGDPLMSDFTDLCYCCNQTMMQRNAVQPVATLHDDGHYTFKPGKEPWGARQAGWRMDVYAPSAQSSKAALSDEDARLSEDDLHARSWWCPTCKKDVPPEMVTKDGEHYLEAGGCGYAVRGELIEDQPKQPLSDEEIHRIWMETPERPTLAEEVLAFGHTLLARAGITRKPLTEDECIRLLKFGQSSVAMVRTIEAAHGITPQAGKESGDGTR